jgi:hypothetical protein
MHDGEFGIDTTLVAELVAEQFPEWSHLQVRDFRSTGTVNTIFRLGNDLYAYAKTNPEFVGQAVRTVEEVLAESTAATGPGLDDG